ncbi:MAG: DUF4406 domain-containing protein [Ignavibacteria bacterium]|nr:DUF4406 domain-containing protein [Ignavibacteria bacterium]
MKVYIAGKISGLPRDEVERLFNEAENFLTSIGYETINPIKIVPPDYPWDIAMKTLVPYLQKCDAICLLPNWKNSMGANVEKALAKLYGKQILFYKNLRRNYASPIC